MELVELGKEKDKLPAKIRVIGVGGGGCNAVNRMIEDGFESIDFIAANTDRQSLDGSKAASLILLGEKLTKGLGAGGDPDVGRKAADESREELRRVLEDSKIVFVTTGMGGGTGTGGVSVVAEVAKEIGALTIAVVTKPFIFEGSKKKRRAEIGITELKKHVDSLLVVPNQKLMEILDPDVSLIDAFKRADQVLSDGVRSIADLIVQPGVVNLDLEDLRTIMGNKGLCHMGTGRGSGKKGIDDASNQAINSPLLDTKVNGAQFILISVKGSEKLTLMGAYRTSELIQDIVGDEPEIKVGSSFDPRLQDDEVIVTLIATGFPEELAERSGYGPEPLSSPFDKSSPFEKPSPFDKSSAARKSYDDKPDEKSSVKRVMIDGEKQLEMPFFWERRNNRD